MPTTIRRQLLSAFTTQLAAYFAADPTVTVTHNAKVATDLKPGAKVVNILDGTWEKTDADASGPRLLQHVHVEAQVGLQANADDAVTCAAIDTALDDLYRRVLLAVAGADTLGGLTYGVVEELTGEEVRPDDLGTQPVGGCSVEFGLPYRHAWSDPTVG